jgi:hypothetical protein
MKRLIFITIGIGLMVSIGTNLTSALLAFWLAGAIPGTTFSVSPFFMLLILSLTLIALMLWLKQQQLVKQVRALKADYKKTSRSTPRKATTVN